MIQTENVDGPDQVVAMEYLKKKKEKQFFKCVYGIDSKHLFALELEMKIESLVTFNDKAQISIRNKQCGWTYKLFKWVRLNSGVI